MARKRPVVLIVFAVVQIVFAVFGFCCGGPALILSGGLDALLHLQDRFPKQEQQLDQNLVWSFVAERLPWFDVYMYGTSIVSLVLCVMMIVGAVGMLRLRAWGWYVTLAWAMTSCVYGTLIFAFGVWVVDPVLADANARAFAEIPPPAAGRPDLRPMIEQFIWMGTLIGWVFSVPTVLYPYLALGILYLASMRKAFRPETPPTSPVDESIPTTPDAVPPSSAPDAS